MSINEMQFKIESDKIAYEYLVSGTIPSKMLVNSKVLSKLKDKTLGLPFFSPVFVKKYEASNEQMYNKTFKELSYDLDVLFKENKYQNDRVINMIDYYNNQKSIINNKLTKLTMLLNNIENTGKEDSFENVSVTFDNMYDVELSGEPNRNIGRTTCFVDILNSSIYNSLFTNKSNEINISNSICLASLDDKDILSSSTHGYINSIVNTSINDIYTIKEIKKDNTKSSITVSVELKDTIDINTISIDFSTSEEITASLLISEDGINKTELNNVSGFFTCKWCFPTSKIKYLYITLNKKSADGIANNLYEYFYSIKSIKVFNTKYDYSSVYISKPICFNAIPDNIKLDFDASVPSGTRVDSYIGLDYGDNIINWININNKETINLNTYDDKIKVFYGPSYNYDSNIKDDDIMKWGNIDWINSNGANSKYKFPVPIKLTDEIEYIKPIGVKLYIGYEHCFVSKTSLKVDVSEVDLHSVHYDHLEVLPPMLLEDLKYLNLSNDTILKLLTYVDLDNDYVMKNQIIKWNGNSSVTIYINDFDNPISVSNGKLFDMRFKRGTNKIIILIANSNSSILESNINFSTISDFVFMGAPAKFSSFQEMLSLRNKYEALDYKSVMEETAYTVIDNKIYVSYNPSLVKHMMIYKQLKEKLRGKKPCVRVMFKISSPDINITPTINSYSLTSS